MAAVEEDADVPSTGNGSPRPALVTKSAGTEQHENIFLFWPNIVGMSICLSAVLPLD
jgi:hypothetical protein